MNLSAGRPGLAQQSHSGDPDNHKADRGIAYQGFVASVGEPDREPALERRGTGNSPAIREAARHWSEGAEAADAWNIVGVADHKPISCVVGGVSVIIAEIKRIRFTEATHILEARCRIEGMRPGVSCQER